VTLSLYPVSLAEANHFVMTHHRHHGRVQGHKFSIGLLRGDELVGVCIVGRPVARMLDDGLTLEVTRCCVMEGVPNGCSKLYGAAWRACKAIGYRKLVTYTLKDEAGVSLCAAGWRVVHEVKGRSWNSSSRARIDKHPTTDKLMWEAGLEEEE